MMTATATFTPTMTTTAVVAYPTAIPVTPIFEATPRPEQESFQTAFPWWQVWGLVGLMIVISSASVVDPRPQAVRRLAESMKQMSESGHLEVIHGDEEL